MKITNDHEAKIRVMGDDCQDSYAVSTRNLSGSELVSNLSGSPNLTGSIYKPTVTVSTKNRRWHP